MNTPDPLQVPCIISELPIIAGTWTGGLRVRVDVGAMKAATPPIRKSLIAAYPDADVKEGSNALAYGIAGDRSRFVLEVRTENQGDSGLQAGTVYMIHVDPLEWGLSSISGGDTDGFCAIGV